METDVDKRGQALESALSQADQMIATFEAILRIARIGSGERRAHFTQLSLGQLAQETADIYAAVIEDSGRAFRLNIDSDVSIQGDRELLIQLLANFTGKRYAPLPS